jgi:hypothetical protein
VVLLRGIAHLVTAESERLFYKRASVPEATSLGSRPRVASDPRMCQTGKRTGRLNKTREW